MAPDKKDKDGILDDVVQKLAESISSNSHNAQLEEHLPHFNVRVGIVKKKTDTYKVKEILVYPSIEGEVRKAASYSIRSNGSKKSNGNPLFYDKIKITGSDGKDAKIKGKYGDLIGFLERLYLALMIIFKPDVLVKKSGLRETDPKYQAAMQTLEEYKSTLEKVKALEESEPEELDHKVEYFEVHGEDLLKKIADYKMSG